MMEITGTKWPMATAPRDGRWIVVGGSSPCATPARWDGARFVDDNGQAVSGTWWRAAGGDGEVDQEEVAASDPHGLPEENDDPDVRWHWRNCRSLGIELHFWVWPWAAATYREEDIYGGRRGLQLGPFLVGLSYSIGNRSSDNRLEAWVSLSEVKAYERAVKFERR